MDKPRNHPRISQNQPEAAPDYRAMAELRYEVRRFLRFSENAARAAGLEPQQHQLLLALKGLPAGMKPTITVLAERLQIQHHSAVELTDRLMNRRLVRRYRSRTDRRQVYVRLTQSGEELLKKLSLHHLNQLKSVGPGLAQVLNAVIATANKSDTPDKISSGHLLEADKVGQPAGRKSAKS
ncbi:MAG TPA: MarR family transcriptional regulator [Candidatus Binatia bacterium]|jgi:DNA-binding MarR family transcriptional regulator